MKPRNQAIKYGLNHHEPMGKSHGRYIMLHVYESVPEHIWRDTRARNDASQSAKRQLFAFMVGHDDLAFRCWGCAISDGCQVEKPE